MIHIDWWLLIEIPNIFFIISFSFIITKLWSLSLILLSKWCYFFLLFCYMASCNIHNWITKPIAVVALLLLLICLFMMTSFTFFEASASIAIIWLLRILLFLFLVMISFKSASATATLLGSSSWYPLPRLVSRLFFLTDSLFCKACSSFSQLLCFDLSYVHGLEVNPWLLRLRWWRGLLILL